MLVLRDPFASLQPGALCQYPGQGPVLAPAADVSQRVLYLVLLSFSFAPLMILSVLGLSTQSPPDPAFVVWPSLPRTLKPGLQSAC